jgi:polyferredoxin/Flp pilus assembly protein TadD
VALPVLAAPPVPVDPGSSGKIKRSRMGRWRAAVLIGVYTLMALHIVQWWWSSHGYGVRNTLSPVEPSESMYTLEVGRINAGFVFFTVALTSTLIFGRFFCGWGCHIVALQDLCGWMMKKMGVHPRPFRSRLLVFAPLLLALYMFVWPTVRREVVAPMYRNDLGVSHVPAWIGEAGRRPGFENAFMVSEYWKTFAPWAIAIPFLLVCGFGTVYFLGAKGFCTYGCPYGGFFAPIDKLAVGRIVVNADKCEGCGHCTAVCTSNVRVHQEVHDFGMVVDPGCMKCMDCVSVCPNEALSFSFAAPPALNATAREGRKTLGAGKRPPPDLTWPEEIIAAALMLVLFLSFRGMADRVPMLMAIAMAGIGSFFAIKLWRLVRDPSVRLAHLQLKSKGRLKVTGWLFAPAATGYLAMGAWAGVVQYHLWRGGLLDTSLNIPADVVFAPGYRPPDADRQLAEAAIAHLETAAAPWEVGANGKGGIGWPLNVDNKIRLSWLCSVAGRLDKAEAYLVAAITDPAGTPGQSVVGGLQQVLTLRGKPADEITRAYRDLAERRPDLAGVHLMLAGQELEAGRSQEAAAESLAAAKAEPRDVQVVLRASELLLRARRKDDATALLDDLDGFIHRTIENRLRGATDELVLGLGRSMFLRGKSGQDVIQIYHAMTEAHPKLAGVRMMVAQMELQAGRGPAAIDEARKAVQGKPRDVGTLIGAAQVYLGAGEPRLALDVLEQARRVDPRATQARSGLGMALMMLSRPQDALQELRAGVDLEPENPGLLRQMAELLGALGRSEEAAAVQARADRLLPAPPPGP